MALLPKVKLKALVNFPGNIVGGTGIEATKANGAVTVDLAFDEFGVQSSIPTSPTSTVITYDSATDSYIRIPSSLLGGAVAGIADAPTDGQQYGRKSGNWTPVSVTAPGTGGQTRPVSNAALEFPTTTDWDTVAHATAQVGVSGGTLFVPGGATAAPTLGTNANVGFDYLGPLVEYQVNGDVFPGGASNAAHRLIYAQDGGSHPAQSHETLAIISRPVGSGANGPGAIDAALAISTSKQNYGSPSAVQGQVDGINIWVRNGGANGVSSDTIAVEANVSSFGTTGAVFGFEMLSTNYSHASVQQWSVNIQGGVIDTLGGHAYGFVTNISKGAGLTGVVVQEAAPGATWTNFFQGNDNTGTTIFNVDRTGIVNTAGRITAKNLILNAPAATAWAFDATGCATVSVPNGGNVALPAGRGFIYLEESAAHNAAMYMMGGGAVNIVNGSQIGACFVASTKTPTAAHASVAFEASDATYRIYNNIGSTVTFTVAGVRIGTSA